MVADVAGVDELGLAGEVEVVGPGGRARGHHTVAVVDVGPDGGRKHARLLGNAAQGLLVRDVSSENVRRTGQRVTHGGKLVGVATGQRPACTGRCGAGQVVGRQLSGEAGRSQQDDVVGAVVARRCHESQS